MKRLNELFVELAPSPLTEYTLKYPDPSIALLYQQIAMRDFWLEDEVCWDTVSFMVQYLDFLKKKDLENETPITLHINSPGGDLSAMFTLYDALKTSPFEVITINEGIAYSAAFIIFLGGSRRLMRPNAVFIAHEGSGTMSGTYRESKSAMQQYEIEVQKMGEIIAANTNLSIEEINRRYEESSDWYIRYKEAFNYGIITEGHIDDFDPTGKDRKDRK